MSKVSARAKKMKCEDDKFWECQQVIFEAGDTLPDHLEGTAKVETKEGQLCFGGDELLPEDFKGSFFVDPCTGESRYLSTDIIPLEVFKASSVLPDFNGPLDVFTETGVATLFGGEVTPADMQGIIFCIDGEICYVGSRPAAVETVTTLNLNGDGSVTYTSEDGTVTTIPAPVVSQLSLAGSVFTHTAGDGTTTSFDLCAVVSANCNSPMIVNADGSVTYTDNAGAVTTIPAPAADVVTTFVINADGSATYTSEDGTASTLPAPVVSSMAAAGSVITHTDGNGLTVSFDICAIVSANCNSPMVANADGSVTYTDNAGMVTIIPAPLPSDSLIVNPDGSVTHTAADGAIVTIPAPTVSALTVAGAVVTHSAGDGTPVSFDICAVVAANCNSPMAINADGSVSYTDNAGLVTVIPAPTNSSVVVDIVSGTFTHTSGDGVDTIVDVCALAQLCAPTLVPGPGANQYTFDNGYGVTQIIDVNEVDMDINSMTVSGSILNWTAEDGTTGSMDVCAVVAANCNSPMVVNADGSISYTDNAGVVTVIPAAVGESVTTFIVNADGSATYTSEDGTVTTLPAQVVSQIAESGGVITHTSGDGSSVSFDICAIVAANCNSTMVVNADGSVTYTDNAGTASTIPAPALPTSSDSSITITPTATGYDFSVNFPDPKTVESTDGTVGVTPTATGCDLSVPVPDPQTFVNGDGVSLVDDQGPASDSFCVQEPLRTCDADGNVIQVPKGFCIMPLEKKICGLKAITGWNTFEFTQTGRLTWLGTLPGLIDAQVQINIIEKDGQMEVNPSPITQVGYKAVPTVEEGSSTYCINMIWLGTEKKIPGCDHVISWRINHNDFDEPSSGSAPFGPIGQSSLTPITGTPSSITGNFLESPPGTYAAAPGAGDAADVKFQYVEANPVSGQLVSAEGVLFDKDFILINNQYRFQEAVEVFTDCDGNFLRWEDVNGNVGLTDAGITY